MADFKIGKGVYIWQPNVIEDGDPARIVSRLQMAGVQSVTVKICDGIRIGQGLQPLIKTLRDNHIRVTGWGYAYLDKQPVQEAQAAAEACRLYEPDMYLIDAEAEAERNDNGARRYMNELRPALADLPLGLNSFWSVTGHPSFPWEPFLSAVDFVCPQVYWRGVDPVRKLKQSQQEYADISVAPVVPMPIVAGDMFVGKGGKPTPAQVIQFLSAADADPSLHGVFMWAADDSQTDPGLWQAFSSYQWKSGGEMLPPQPVGWAKIMARGGLYIRSAPSGNKIGALAVYELTPLWNLDDPNWAAITPTRDQWIYVGNPNWVQMVMDTSNKPAPPPGMFQAKVVPSQGLNVRDTAWGRILRALTVGTLVQVYEENNGWARINPAKGEWVCERYLSKVS